MNPKLRLWVGALFIGLALVPISYQLFFKAESIQAKKVELETIESASDQEVKVSMQRAKTCVVLDPRYPITPKSVVFYDMKKRDRKFPPGTSVCDLNGFTAITTDVGVADIRRVPQEQLTDYLSKQRKFNFGGSNDKQQ